MKPIKIIMGVVIAIPITVFVVGMFLPDISRIERTIQIEAPRGLVFHYVSDHRAFQEWSPWKDLDPNMTVTYAGPDYGLTSKMIWIGNQSVGEGVSEFTEITPHERAVAVLDYGDMGQGISTYELSDSNGGTSVTWSYETQHDSLAERYVGVFLGMLLGPVYEQGLINLKNVAENASPLVKREITYRVAGEDYTGYHVYPKGLIDPVPGVVIVHEWWGHNEYARSRAEMLAQEGYSALALDMYGGGKQASHPEDAMKFMQEVGAKGETAERRFDSAVAVLRNHHFTDPTKIAAIGYCFGGSVVINMARMGKNLAGVASFHGGLGDLVDIEPHAHTPVIVFNGGADPFVPAEQKEAFIREMENSQLSLTFIEFPDAVHSFTNPAATENGEKFGLPFAYDAEADEKSWQQMRNFLESVFY